MENNTIVASSTSFSSGGSFLYLMWPILLILIIVIFMVIYYLLSKNIKTGNKSPKMCVLKKFYIDRNFYIGILKVINDYYIILFSASSAEVLKKTTKEEVEDILGDKNLFVRTFSNYLKREKNKDGQKKN